MDEIKCGEGGGIKEVYLTQAVNITFNKPTMPFWKVLGYKSEDDLINSTHLHVMTKDGYFCATCNADINNCSLGNKKE